MIGFLRRSRSFVGRSLCERQTAFRRSRRRSDGSGVQL
jgi:hypothetical protein